MVTDIRSKSRRVIDVNKSLSVWKRFGKAALLFAVLINGCLIFFSIRQSSLESRFAELSSEENYFIINKKTIDAEYNKMVSLEYARNQSIMLRKLARNYLSQVEYETLYTNDSMTLHKNKSSLVKIVTTTYLLYRDPTAGEDPNEMFRDKTREELQVLFESFQLEAGEYARELKNNMIDLAKQLSFWRMIHSIGLAVNMLFLTAGSIIVFMTE